MPKVTRRQAIQTAGLGAAALTLAGSAAPRAQAAAVQPAKGPFTLPRLPYANDALAPNIDARTMLIHHDRHHQAYVNNLNAAVQGNEELAKQSIEQILRNIRKVPEGIRQAVINNGGGHYNHTMFWEIMSPKGGGKPGGALGKAIESTFTSFAGFQKAFKDAAMRRFGSGWAWLVVSPKGLQITSSANQDCPLMTGQTPILGIDVWEHAYYLHYQNRRADYIDAWWNVVNWPNVAERYQRATKR
ncbi:MAG: superoxide dismutase [Planctomycetes bacterium]|nr:superoxide dismutase [Planctomycetota bacterium]